MRYSREHAIYYGLAAFGLLLVAALWVAAFALLERERAETIEESKYLTRNLASAFEEHTVRVISQVDQVVTRIKAAYEKDGRKVKPLLLVEEHLRLPEILAVITVADAKGNIVLSSIPGPSVNIADREHFRVHVGRDRGQPFIGKPILGRVSGKWSMQVTRRLNHPDGSFAGVAGAAIALEYLGEFFQRLDLGKNSVMVLVGRDGIVRVRQTSEGFSAAQDISERSQALARIEGGELAGSHIVEASPFDSMSRVVSYRALKSYPLVVVVAVAEDEALLEYSRRRPVYLVYGLVATLLICGFVLILGRLVWQQQREQAARNAHAAERRKAEEMVANEHNLLRSVIDALLDHVYAKDREGRYILMNASSRKARSISAHEMVIGKTASELLRPEVAARSNFEDRAVFETGVPLVNREDRIVLVTGEIRWFLATKVPLRDAAGSIVGLIGINRDVTEIRKASEAVRQLNAELELRVAERTRQLELANQELESFSYSVSHDLRAPLRSIDGFSKALLEDYERKLDAEGRDYLNRVRNATRRMASLIDDLLALSRVSRLEMRNDEVDLSALAKEVAEDLQRQEPERRVSVSIQPSMTARADPNLLRIVLQNLLQNAWKFTATTQDAKIEVGMTERGGQAAFFVRDNGVGFEMAYAGKLFGAFQRLHAEAEFPGTGIGLATVQRIIHRHGGEVRAEAEVGKGATIFFTLGAGVSITE